MCLCMHVYVRVCVFVSVYVVCACACVRIYNLTRKEKETIDAENRTMNIRRTPKSVCGKMSPYC